MVSVSDVEKARHRIAGQVHRTALTTATRLGDAIGVSLSFKCESFQKTGSFKVRGALNAVLMLGADQRARGVVTVSAGNHAQALAYAAAASGVKATVVMPAHASPLKVAASRGYGAEVILHGATGTEAFAKARELEKERGLVFVHPFDDPAIIAGAGTIGLELIDDDRADMDIVVVPVGGGGLISGIATAIRARSPKTRIVGVEPEGAAVIRKSLDAGRPLKMDHMNTIADGLTGPMAGDLTFPIIRERVDDVVLVTDDEIRGAVRDLLLSAKLVAEPAGAAGLAAIMAKRVGAQPGSRVFAIISGGNIDLTRLAEIASPH